MSPGVSVPIVQQDMVFLSEVIVNWYDGGRQSPSATLSASEMARKGFLVRCCITIPSTRDGTSRLLVMR